MNKEHTHKPRKDSPSAQNGIPERVRQKPSLGEILQAARAETGLSLQQVAEQVGLSKGGISRVEQGKIVKPTLDTLLALSELYGTDPMTLIEAAGYKLRKPTLPDFKPYLRQKYRHLPEDAKDEIADAFQRITAKYGVSQMAGPINDEDEAEDQTSTEPHTGGRNSEH
jgi:transcriptional regulator with XRE-family HTH domain